MLRVTRPGSIHAGNPIAQSNNSAGTRSEQYYRHGGAGCTWGILHSSLPRTGAGSTAGLSLTYQHRNLPPRGEASERDWLAHGHIFQHTEISYYGNSGVRSIEH